MTHPKPKFINHCEHKPNEYAGRFACWDGKAGDLYFFLEGDKWHYCLRFSNKPEDYASGTVINGRVGFHGKWAEEGKVGILNDRLELIKRLWDYAYTHPMER